MVKTSTIISRPQNYLPLALFTLWAFISTFEYTTPFLNNPLPFLLISICAIGYKFKIRTGKIFTGILLFAYLIGLYKIAPREGAFSLGFTINDIWIGIKFKTAGILFFFIYCFIYRKTETYKKVMSAISNLLRNIIRFMINPEEK